jgi:hypothetical protein
MTQSQLFGENPNGRECLPVLAAEAGQPRPDEFSSRAKPVVPHEDVWDEYTRKKMYRVKALSRLERVEIDVLSPAPPN